MNPTTTRTVHSSFTGRIGTPALSPMTTDDIASLFRNLCGIELSDVNSPHRLLRLVEHEVRRDVINHAALCRLQDVLRASPSIPESHIKWMSDRVTDACNAMLSQVPPPALVSPPAPPPVPSAAVSSSAASPMEFPGPPIVLRRPVVYRSGNDVAQIALGIVSLFVIVFVVGFGAVVFANPAPKVPRKRLPPTPVRTTEDTVIQTVGGNPAEPSNEGQKRPPKPIVAKADGRAQALRHLKDAVAKIKDSLFDVGEEYARKAYKADPTCAEANAVLLVSGYVREYTRLADEARKALNGSNTFNLGPSKGECAFIEQGDGWVTFRVNGKNTRFTDQELSNIKGLRFRITRQFLDNASNPGNDLILGAYQYIHCLDPDGKPLGSRLNPIPDRWVRATHCPDAITREHAAQMLELPRLELHK
jgi:hypothetical protein